MANVNPVGAAPVGGPKDENYIDFVMKRQKQSANYHQAIYNKFKNYYDLYRGITSRRFPQHRNNIHTAFPLSIIQNSISRKVMTLFGAYPIVTFSGVAPEDAANAKRNEILITAQMQDCDSFSKAVDFFTSSEIHGTGIAKVGWTFEAEEEYYRFLNPAGAEQIGKRPVVTFDGPDWEVLDILDTFPQAGVRRINDMLYFIYRYYLDLDKIEERAVLGAYDMSAVNELKRGPMGNTAEREMTERRTIYRSQQDWEARQNEHLAKPVEIIEYWGIVPKELGVNGITNRVISIGNGRVLLRNRDFPFFIKKKPFFASCPMPDPMYFHGIGKIEPIAKLALTADRLASQKLDALEIWMDPVIIATAGVGLDKDNMVMRAGKVFTADGPIDDANFKAISPDLRGMQTAYTEIESLWRWIQQATGMIEDTVMGGGGGPSRETATGFAGRAEGVASRIMLEVMSAERSLVEPLANYFRALNRQWLKLPHTVKILGSTSQVNPITGFPLPAEPTEINHDDVNMDYRARAVGATQMISRQMKRQDAIALQNLMQSNPVLLQMINWYAFGKETFSRFDYHNADMFFNQQPTGVNMVGAGGTASPELGPEAFSMGAGGIQ